MRDLRSIKYYLMIITPVLLFLMAFIIVGRQIRFDSPNQICLKDSDCILAVDLRNKTCRCPEAVNKKVLRTRDWAVFEKGKNYNDDVPVITGCACVSYELYNVVCHNFSCQSSYFLKR